MNLPSLKEARKRSKKKALRIDYYLNEMYEGIGNNKKYFIKTYGCQMNEHDSENMSALLESVGFLKTDIMEDADVIVLNTCSIRENANNKVFGMLGRIKHLKEFKKDVIVGIAGCMPQEEVVVEEILNKYKWIDFVIGTHNIHSLIEKVSNAMNNKQLDISVYSIEGDVYENIPVKRDNLYTAYVNIMYGCDKFCTYCIVPYTRGKQRSRLMEDIVKEVKELVDNGYKEVILLGQNVNAYGKDLEFGYGMCDLLENVAKTNIERIRFVTSHPWDFSDYMIDIMAKYDNIMPSLHLPVQSGSSRILKLMGRRYTKEEYLTLYKKLKDKIPGISITTDIIVGFPNESDEDFNDTLNLVNECRFDLAYTFIYSKRVGTPAAKMEDLIPLSVKEERLQTLNNLINKHAKENNDLYLGKKVSVLCLGVGEKDPNMLYGYSKHNKLVNFTGDKDSIGKIVQVNITSCKTWSLDGEMII